MGRAEDAVGLCRQAADIYGRRDVGDLAKEGMARSNMAGELLKLRHHNEARRELHRAVECNKPSGHAAEPWKTFSILTKLERAAGNAPAAEQAHQQAVATYLAYRRDGGESIVGGSTALLCEAVGQAIAEGRSAQAYAELVRLSKAPECPDCQKPLLTHLQSILAGSRDRALAADPNLEYFCAAELHLLLDRLGVKPG